MENKYLRFKKVFNDIGLSQSEYKSKCGVNQDTISNLLTGKKKDFPDSLMEFLDRSGYNLSYLFGAENMRKAVIPPKGIIETQQEQIALLWESIAQLKDNAQRDREKIQNLERKVSKTG